MHSPVLSIKMGLILLVILGAFTLCLIVAIRKRWIWPFVVLGGMLFAGILVPSVHYSSSSSRTSRTSNTLTTSRTSSTLNPTITSRGVTYTEIVNVAPTNVAPPVNVAPVPLARKGDRAADSEPVDSHTTTSWNSIDTKQFRTNTFPSAASAAKDLAKQVPTLLEEMYDNFADLPEFKIQATISAQKADDEFREELLKQFPKTTFGTGKKTDNGKKNEADTAASKTGDSKTDTAKIVHIKLVSTGLGSRTSAWDPPRHTDTGTLSCIITSDQGSRSIRADYIEKPWVEQQDQFFSAYPARRFAVGSSTTLCESVQAARRSAMQSLQDIELSALWNGRKLNVVINDSLIIDRFLQKLERPYGTVWREAILVDLNGRKAESLIARTIDQVRTHTQSERESRSSTRFNIFVLIAVFAVTAMAGTVLNWITEGYFRGKITLVVIIFVIVILFYARMMRMERSDDILVDPAPVSGPARVIESNPVESNPVQSNAANPYRK